METVETALPGVLLLKPRVFGDARGFFLETYRESVAREAGIPALVQDNHSRSRRGVLRGLHYQLEQPQGKLVRAARGRVFDVAVDIRMGSPHFGQWTGAMLDDESHHMLWVPPGFAHGFVTLSEDADFLYRCSDYYHPASEAGIRWDDPEIGIDWPQEVLDAVKLSEKDAALPRLAEQARGKLPVFEG